MVFSGSRDLAAGMIRSSRKCTLAVCLTEFKIGLENVDYSSAVLEWNTPQAPGLAGAWGEVEREKFPLSSQALSTLAPFSSPDTTDYLTCQMLTCI